MKLSYTKLSRFETCPLAYKLQHIDKLAAEPGTPLLFGKAVHAVLEQLVREHVEAKAAGTLSKDRATELWQEVWTDLGLSGLALFQEGLELVHGFIGEQGALDHRSVVSVEKKFQIKIGDFDVIGYIDRVDRIDDETIEIIDYKTNRQPFSRDEVDDSLQLALYDLAARELWPWAKTIRLTFWMLRHGIRQTVTHTETEAERTRTYIETLGKQIEATTEFPGRLNTNCIWCDHRQHCPVYAEALEGRRQFICKDPENLDAVAKEREEVASLAKILYGRKGELDKVLKAALKEQDELALGGVRYKMIRNTRLDYRFEPTLRVLEEATGMPRDELVSKVGAINKKAVDQLVKDSSKDRAHARLLKAELEFTAKATFSPRLWARAAS